MLSRSFSLVPFRTGVSGVVEITDNNGNFAATISARGLSVGTTSIHSVHIHQGSCANAYGGIHLTVLGTLVANAMGSGTLVAGLASRYVSPGHYVIVYATTSPQTIVACADLASLA